MPIIEQTAYELELRHIEVKSTVRGGGLGNTAYVVRLTGLDSKWTFSREYLIPINDLSNSRKSGALTFNVPAIEGSIWECCRIMPCACDGSISGGTRTWWMRIADGASKRISRAKAVELLAGY